MLMSLKHEAEFGNVLQGDYITIIIWSASVTDIEYLIWFVIKYLRSIERSNQARDWALLIEPMREEKIFFENGN